MARRRKVPIVTETMEFHTKVVGVTHTNRDGTNRQNVVRRLRAGQPLLLIRDPKNRHDRNAIMICTSGGFFSSSKQVGFLSAELAAEYAPFLDAGGQMQAEVTEVTGGGGWLWWRKNYGVNVNVTVLPNADPQGEER